MLINIIICNSIIYQYRIKKFTPPNIKTSEKTSVKTSVKGSVKGPVKGSVKIIKLIKEKMLGKEAQ